MKFRFPLLLAVLWHAGATAQEAQPGTENSNQNFRVLSQQQVVLDDRSIFYNFVETPRLEPLPVVLPTPSPAFDEFEPSSDWNSKPEVMLFVSATVYDHKVTEIRWWREEGEYVFWSSADFNLLRGLFDWETSETRYSLFLALENETRADVEAWNAYIDANGLAPNLKRKIPTIQASGFGRSNHRLVTPPNLGTKVETLRALEEIHRYFDANQSRLTREYEESEAARIAHEEWLRLNPPSPRDSTISFFPIRSVYREDQTP